MCNRLVKVFIGCNLLFLSCLCIVKQLWTICQYIIKYWWPSSTLCPAKCLCSADRSFSYALYCVKAIGTCRDIALYPPGTWFLDVLLWVPTASFLSVWLLNLCYHKTNPSRKSIKFTHCWHHPRIWSNSDWFWGKPGAGLWKFHLVSYKTRFALRAEVQHCPPSASSTLPSPTFTLLIHFSCSAMQRVEKARRAERWSVWVQTWQPSRKTTVSHRPSRCHSSPAGDLLAVMCGSQGSGHRYSRKKRINQDVFHLHTQSRNQPIL